MWPLGKKSWDTLWSILTPSSASGETSEDDHSHIETLLDPDLVHDSYHLQSQHILPQVIS